MLENSVLERVSIHGPCGQRERCQCVLTSSPANTSTITYRTPFHEKRFMRDVVFLALEERPFAHRTAVSGKGSAKFLEILWDPEWPWVADSGS